LFSKSDKQRDVDLNSPLRLIYSGRLSAQKNIEAVIAFYSFLEATSHNDVELIMTGDWDNLRPDNRGFFKIDSYEQDIKKFSKQISFKNEPIFLHGLGPNEWQKTFTNNSVVLSLSTSMYEDYGVSIAQAQECGLPIIISDWGGHGDVNGDNIYKFPISTIGESYISSEAIILKSKYLAEKFFENKEAFKVTNQTSEEYSLQTMAVDFELLCDLRQNFLFQYGNEAAFLGHNKLALFAGSQKGQQFFVKYRKIFSGDFSI
jgi:glycosyltransferase involved in cell wall biosynthesis